jgi:hypothetical protein
MRIDRILSILAAVVLACGKVEPSGDAGGPDASNDGATADGGGQDANATCTYLAPDPQCETLPQGPLLTVGCTSSPPTPQGGTVVDGFYQLTQVDWDATANPCPSQTLTHRGTLEICGDTLVWLDIDETKSNGIAVAHIQTSGTTITFQEFCGDQSTFAFDYTASGTELVIFFVNVNGERLVMHFSRQ